MCIILIKSLPNTVTINIIIKLDRQVPYAQCVFCIRNKGLSSGSFQYKEFHANIKFYHAIVTSNTCLCHNLSAVDSLTA
jgi:hypothetical protein